MSMTITQTPRPAAAPQAPATPATPVIGPTTDLATLQTQLNELQMQHTQLKAQWDGLRRQLDNMLQTNPARPGVAQSWANVGEQLAQVDGQMAMINARIAQKEGRPVGTTETAFPPRRGPDPDMVVGMSLGLLMMIAIPISIAYARRIWRGKPQPPAPRLDDFNARFDRIEQAVDAIAIEVERVSEGQRFVTKLMAERPMASADNTPSKPAALGAGPAQPVSTPERDAVRPRNG